MFELTGNKLILTEGDDQVGYILYDEQKDHFVVTYIYVKPEHRGKNYANKLIDEFVRITKERNFKILPICSVTSKILHQKYEEIIL